MLGITLVPTSTLGHLFRVGGGHSSAGRVLASAVMKPWVQSPAPHQLGVLLRVVIPALRSWKKKNEKFKIRVGEMAHWIMALAAKSDDLSLMLEPTRWKEKTDSRWLVAV